MTIFGQTASEPDDDCLLYNSALNSIARIIDYKDNVINEQEKNSE
jgi:hypothetical protein